jgi:hypothetical protein
MIINAVLTVVVPTTVVLAIALDVMAVVAWISGRPKQLERPGRPTPPSSVRSP